MTEHTHAMVTRIILKGSGKEILNEQTESFNEEELKVTSEDVARVRDLIVDSMKGGHKGFINVGPMNVSMQEIAAFSMEIVKL